MGVRSIVEVTNVIIVLNVGKLDIFPESAEDHLLEEQKEDTQLAVWRYQLTQQYHTGRTINVNSCVTALGNWKPGRQQSRRRATYSLSDSEVLISCPPNVMHSY